MGLHTASAVLQMPKVASNGHSPEEGATCTGLPFSGGKPGIRGHVAKAHSPDGQDHSGGRGEIF